MSESDKNLTFSKSRINIGRVDCVEDLESICKRINLGAKPPRFMILAKHVVYRFRGNLTYDFIEN